MVIEAEDERDFISKYISVVSKMTSNFNPREIQVATEFVFRYRTLYSSYCKLSKETQSTFDIMDNIKSRKSLDNMVSTLDMSFGVFRNYVSSLKNKGFFISGKINSIYIPEDNKAVITIVYE